MGFAERMGRVADRLLTKYDERTVKVKLLRAGESYFDKTIGETVFPEPTEIDLTGVATSYNAALINGTTIQASDIKFISRRNVEPKQADKVLLDGHKYSIVGITPKAYTGIDKVISYEIQIRK